jgi:hypothetical protein
VAPAGAALILTVVVCVPTTADSAAVVRPNASASLRASTSASACTCPGDIAGNVAGDIAVAVAVSVAVASHRKTYRVYRLGADADAEAGAEARSEPKAGKRVSRVPSKRLELLELRRVGRAVKRGQRRVEGAFEGRACAHEKGPQQPRRARHERDNRVVRCRRSRLARP